MISGVRQVEENTLARLAQAALGLTFQEAKNAFRQVIFKNGALDISDVNYILKFKQEVLKTTEILSLVNSDLSLDDVVGFNSLKLWLIQQKKSWHKEARSYGIPRPKGLLITGSPGCGQNLIFKAIGAIWQLPVLCLNLDKILSVNGEENIRQAIKISEAIAPVILWIDEIEKGFSSPEYLNIFLTWMTKKTKPVFLAATAINLELIPKSLLVGKDYFDEIFFVDLPNHQERIELFELHLKQRFQAYSFWKNIKFTQRFWTEFAKLTKGFVGTEIEQIVAGAVFEAFLEDRSINLDDFLNSIEKIVPYSLLHPEDISSRREWAKKNRAVLASTETVLKTSTELIYSLREICARYRGTNYYFEHLIPESKLAETRSALLIPKKEKVIALIDTTIWKSQVFQGLAIGCHGIYWLNEKDSSSKQYRAKSLDWYELATISIECKQGSVFELGQGNILWVDKTVLQGKTLDLLLEIQSLVRNYQLDFKGTGDW